MSKKNLFWYSCDVPVVLVWFNKNWIFSTYLEKPERANFMEFRLLVAKSFHVDGQINRHTCRS